MKIAISTVKTGGRKKIKKISKDLFYFFLPALTKICTTLYHLRRWYKNRQFSALIIFVALTLGSFALWAQDDMGEAQGHVSDEQVIQEMNQYLDHLNGDDNSSIKHEHQLNLLKNLVPFWKNPSFRNLRSLSLEDIFKNQLDDPYAITALAFHNDDIESFVESASFPINLEFSGRAILFRERLGSRKYYQFHSTLHADDIGFTNEPSQLSYIQKDGPLDSGAPFLFIRDLNTNAIVHSSTLSDEFIQNIFDPSAYFEKSLIANFYLAMNVPKPKEPLQLKIWDFTKNTFETIFALYPYHSHAISYDQKLLAWVENGCCVNLRNLSTHKTTGFNIFKESEISSISFSPKDNVLVLGTKSGLILTYDLITQEKIVRQAPASGAILPGAIFQVALHPNHKIAAYTRTTSDDVQLINMDTGKALPPYHSKVGRIQGNVIKYSPLGDLMIYQHSMVYPPSDTHDHIELIDDHGHLIFTKDYWSDVSSDSKPQKVEFSSDGEWMAILHFDQTVQIYKRDLPILDLESILLIDPHKLTPASGGRK